MRNFLIWILCLVSVKSFGQVSLQKGAAEVSLPVYEFKDNISRLKFDLNVNYSSGAGLTVDEIPGNLGAGWELGGIPKIIRIQKGRPDDENTGSSTPSGIIYQNKFVGQRGCPVIANYYPISNELSFYDEAKIVSDDKTEDEFNVFLNGRLITFYLRTKFALSQDEMAAITLNGKDPARITVYAGNPPNDGISSKTQITHFEILDSDGLAYIFSEREYGKVFEYNSPGAPMGVDIARFYCREVINDTTNKYVVTAWGLSKIIDKKNGRKINLDYETQIFEYENFTNLYAGSDNSSQPFPPQMPPGIQGSIYSVYVTLRKNKIISKQIKNINLPTGERINFSYDSTQRYDVKGGYHLDEIIIKSRDGKRLFKYSFTFGYFVKNQIKIPLNAYEEKWSRLCLTQIQQFGTTDYTYEQPYLFSYYLGKDSIENFVPPLFFHAKDPWGFFNGSILGVDISGFIDKSTATLSDWRRLASYGRHNINSVEEMTFAETIKLNYAMNGLLKSYTSPNGDLIEYHYYQNETKVGSYERFSGGVHVSSITITDGSDSTVKKQTEYDYTLTDGSSSLWGAESPRGVSKIVRHYKAEGSYNTPAVFNEISYSFGTSYFSIGRFIDNHGSAFFHTALSILQRPTPINITVAIGNLIFDLFKGSNNPEQTVTQYYFHRDPLNFFNPLPTQFSRVTVKSSSIVGNEITENGRTEYEFTSDKDFAPIIPNYLPGDTNFNPHFFSQSQRSHSWMYGLPKAIRIYRQNESVPVKETQYFYRDTVVYDSRQDTALASCNCQPVYFDSKKITDYNMMTADVDQNFTTITVPDKLYVDFIHIQAGYPILQKIVEENNNGGAISITNTSNFEYNSQGLLKSKKATNSKGQLLENRFYYHSDFYQPSARPDNIYTRLFDDNRGNELIAIETWRTAPSGQTKDLVASKIFEFGAISNGDYRLINEYSFESQSPVPENMIKSFSYTTPPPINRNSSFFKLKNQIIYNQRGGVAGQNLPERNANNGVVLGYDQQYVISEFTNATIDEIAYTSFETNENNLWDYDSSMVIDNESSVTGGKALQLVENNSGGIRLSQYFPTTTPKPYLLSFWANSPEVSINGVSSSPLESKPENGWYFFKLNFSAGAPEPVISGSCLIDELRWYPKDAMMETYTYNDFGSQSSYSSVDDRVTYYEYDELNRLILIRDKQQHILKKYCYTPQGQPGNCACVGKDLQPDWQNNTTPRFRCQQEWTTNTNPRILINNGIQEQEQTDQNPCSQTFNTVRWIAIGTNLAACPLPCNESNCKGPGKKCINGECQTGRKVCIGSQPYISPGGNPPTGSGNPPGPPVKINAAGGDNTPRMAAQSATTYQNTYRYEWNDGTYSEEFTERSSSPCAAQ